jgi:hypothetical protein
MLPSGAKVVLFIFNVSPKGLTHFSYNALEPGTLPPCLLARLQRVHYSHLPQT